MSQGSIWGPYFFFFFRNNLYFFITKASLHNYADDNTLSAYSSALNSLTDKLIEESQTSINWLKANHMIVKPKKFQVMSVSTRKNTIPEDLTISVNDANIKPNNSVKLLGITLDNKINFEKHITSIWKSTSCQLNALFRLKYFLGFKGRKILIENFVYSNSNYCPLVQHLCNQKSSQKVESLQKISLQFLQNDYTSGYDDLLENSNKSAMAIQRLRTLFCFENFKTLHQLNPFFMSNIFEIKSSDRPVHSQQNLNLKVVRANQVKFSEKSLRVFEPRIRNRLPTHIKNAENLSAFKRLIKPWDGVSCKCNLCRKIWIHV